jgi:hypothetical protein
MFQVEITQGGNFWGTRKWKQAVVRCAGQEWVLRVEEADDRTSYTVTGPGTEGWRPKLKRLNFDGLLQALLEFITAQNTKEAGLEELLQLDNPNQSGLEKLLRPDNPSRSKLLKLLWDRGLLRFPRS